MIVAAVIIGRLTAGSTSIMIIVIIMIIVMIPCGGIRTTMTACRTEVVTAATMATMGTIAITNTAVAPLAEATAACKFPATMNPLSMKGPAAAAVVQGAGTTPA